MDAQPRPARRRTGSETRQRTAVVALRLLPHEREALDAIAQARGVSVSELVRSSALQQVEDLADRAEVARRPER